MGEGTLNAGREVKFADNVLNQAVTPTVSLDCKYRDRAFVDQIPITF